MKMYVLSVLIVLQINVCQGQIFTAKEKDKLFNPGKYATSAITLDAASFAAVRLPAIAGIDVLDARADTFALGYMKKGLLSNYKKIRFATPGVAELETFCRKLVVADTGNPQFNMLLVVKELWLSEEDNDLDAKDKIQDVNEKLFPTSNVKVNFEFYIGGAGKFFPVCRFDTTLLKTLPLKTYAPEYIETALALGISKVAKYNFLRISTTKTAVTMDGIHNFNERRFRYRVLKDSSLQKGVYLSLDDFKNNNPSITEYEIKRGNLGDVLYTKTAAGNWVVSRSVWGYSDGNDAFIKLGDNYYRLFRINNSFYFNGSREISRTDYYNNGEKTTLYRNLLSPFKLNVENGTVY